MKHTYSNPRMNAEIPNWPFGSNLRTTAYFEVENGGFRGERCVRQMNDPRTHRPCVPKKLTYSVKQRIVDGDDGKTYIACLNVYDNIYIMRGDMQHYEETVAPESAEYAELIKFFND